MTANVYKQQAVRLQSFLQNNPLKAGEMQAAKYSTCLHAVAAMHGARNWNTLSASLGETETTGSSPSAVPRSPGRVRDQEWPIHHDEEGGLVPCADVPPVFGGMVAPGKVLHSIDPERFRSTYVNKMDLADALGQGYYVTALSASAHLKAFTQGMDGVSVTASATSLGNGLTAPMTHIDFQGWLLSSLLDDTNSLGANQAFRDEYWKRLEQLLSYRSGPGFLLVLTDLGRLSSLGINFDAMLQCVERSRARGSAIVVCAQSTEEIQALQGRLAPDNVVQRVPVVQPDES